jgi:opacity protein-like surface antigen
MASPGSLVRSLVGALALLAAMAASAATAADLGLPPLPEEAPPVDDRVEFGTGWYIRGDLAYARDSLPNIGELGTYPNASPRNTFSMGLGGGYKFTNWFRTDLTADFRQPLRSTDVATRADVSGGRWDALANGYIDLGTWWGFTPYVGAGVGGAWGRAKITTYDAAISCTNGGTVLCFHSRTPVALAWALMAGAAYEIMPHFYLDIGYRYLNLGSYSFWDPSEQASITAFTGNAATARSQVQEIRLGLRYLID